MYKKHSQTEELKVGILKESIARRKLEGAIKDIAAVPTLVQGHKAIHHTTDLQLKMDVLPREGRHPDFQGSQHIGYLSHRLGAGRGVRVQQISDWSERRRAMPKMVWG
jgi:hypothetical protein